MDHWDHLDHGTPFWFSQRVGNESLTYSFYWFIFIMAVIPTSTKKRLIHSILIYGEDFGAWIHRLEQDPPQLVSWLCGRQLQVSVLSFIFSHENRSEEECNGALT